MKLRLHRIFICQAFAMLRNVQQRKLRLSPFEQHGVPFTLVVAESDPFSVLLIYNSTRGNNRGESPSLK